MIHNSSSMVDSIPTAVQITVKVQINHNRRVIGEPHLSNRPMAGRMLRAHPRLSILNLVTGVGHDRVRIVIRRLQIAVMSSPTGQLTVQMRVRAPAVLLRHKMIAREHEQGATPPVHNRHNRQGHIFITVIHHRLLPPRRNRHHQAQPHAHL